jgi:hypothetical protein
MKFIRSILGTTDADPGPTDADPGTTDTDTRKETAHPAAAEPGDAVADEATHEVAVQREFSRGLSDLAHRQLQFEKYRWEPPAQTDPRGTWYVTEEVETDELVLRPGTALEFVERAGNSVTSPWRMRTTEGRTIELPIEADPDSVALPAGLGRTAPGSREAG